MPDNLRSSRDQAKDLRRMVSLRRRPAAARSSMRSVAILSGKGGVGKSNFAVNLSLALAERDERIILMDADLGMANVDLLCGLSPKFNLAHVIREGKELKEILLPLGDNIMILPGGPGVRDLADLEEEALSILIDDLSALEVQGDMLVIDTGAGIHKNIISFGAAADEAILLTTPEPTSIRDAYGVLKALAFATANKVEVLLVVNMVATEEEGHEVADRIRTAASQFLGISPKYYGFILRDDAVAASVRRRTPLLSAFPDAPASNCIRAIAARMLNIESGEESYPAGRGVKAFFFRLARGFGLRR